MIPIGILTAAATSNFVGLLDDYPNATAAYSLRKLRNGYSGSCIQVRRSSDNTTLNIGFSNNVIDTTSLLTFCGVSDGFVSIWYDQSGNSKDAIQNTLANQPKIVTAGVVITINGKPSLQVDNTDFLSFTTTDFTLRTTFSVIKRSSSGVSFFPYGGGISHYQFSDNRYYFETNTAFYGSTLVDITSDQILMSGYNSNSSTIFQYKNNVLLPSPITTTISGTVFLSALFTIGRNPLFSSGFGQEIILYSFNNSSNLSDINTNINTFYNIY
jgi:hypothetical protein